MTHISSIGSGMFSALSVGAPVTPLTSASITTLSGSNPEAAYSALFATEISAINGVKAAAAFIQVPNVREFPEMGTPPNIVNVPRFGAATSAQIQGQSDAPTFELTVNYVPAEWAKGTTLGDMLKDGVVRAFRFALLNTKPTAGFASTPTAIGQVENSLFYFLGKLEAITYNPQLTDANQSTVTISMLTDMAGAYTVAPT